MIWQIWINSVWIKFGDNWFFLDETGKMVKQRWIKYYDNLYYINKRGEMTVDTYILNKGKCYYVNHKGELVEKIKKSKRNTFIPKE